MAAAYFIPSQHPSQEEKGFISRWSHQAKQLGLQGMSMHGFVHPPSMKRTKRAVHMLMCERGAGTAAFQRLTDEAARTSQSPEAGKRLKPDASKATGEPLICCT